MVKKIERGQTITFRVPSDTPDYLLKQLQQLKDIERRNFSSKIAHFVLKGVHETVVRERETVTVPLPKPLTREQKSWLKHEHSEAMIGSILYQLLTDPKRVTSIMTTLNKEIEEADQYLGQVEERPVDNYESAATTEFHMDDLDIGELDVHNNEENTEEEAEEEDPLGDFFSSMNK
ncbi:hypothetical protein [Oceanobacillus sp. 1P07AA]|uniref:hypothetical protein n=1 Tax=Oceanobacillus sp. 1P07AA TaxID=3132293 RepID=UPI0039A67C7C